ncbi:MAG: hypothetical protein ISS47_01620 [Candidatus Omnitrophica bacterium]|nr:hypothetical protein [Candidatus Omnitrophota bacterium]
MSFLFFLIASFAAVGLLIVHSYFLRGPRITFNFFFFIFLYAYRWVMRIDVFAPFRPPSKEIRILEIIPLTTSNLSAALVSFCLPLIIILGWMFAFYISWSMAERILRRIEIFNGKIFITILLSGLIVGGIFYSIETMAIGVDWLRLRFNDPRFGSFLIESSFVTIKARFYFVIYFLTAFFLIECSRFRRVNWKCIFFLLANIHIWTVDFLGFGLPRIIERTTAIILLLPLSFLSPLRFEYGQAEWPESVKFSLNIRRLLTNIPLFMILFMLAFVTVMDLVVARQPALLVSALPVFFFLLLCINKIPFYFILILAVVLFAVIGSKFVPSLIPVGFISLLKIANELIIKRA